MARDAPEAPAGRLANVDWATSRAAVVHDWLVTYAGSERVLAEMLRALPTADVFTLIDRLPAADRSFLEGHRVSASALGRIPLLRSRHRALLPLMPLTVEQFDLSAYELVVSSSHAVAKGVLTGPDQLHVCMCYSPIRYAWDLQHQYLAQSGLDRGLRGLLARWLLHRLRRWDVRSASGVDHFIAISHFIARRIEKAYRRPSTVVYPPVDVQFFTPAGDDARDDYYVTASRFVPYKCVDAIVEAFRDTPHRRLVVIGDGPQAARIRRLASPNVELLGHVSRDDLRTWLRGARAFLFCAVEDFGIAPLEAQACGVPVIAFGGGALPETVPGLDAEEPCGVHFPAQTPEGVRLGVDTFEAHAGRIDPRACRRNAERFSHAQFDARFAALMTQLWDGHRHRLAAGDARLALA